MAKEDELIIDVAEQESAQERQREEKKPETVSQWLGNVEAALHEVLPEHKRQQLEQIFAAAKAAQEASGKQARVGKEVSDFFDDLKLDDVERLLRELEALESKTPTTSKSAEEIVVYKKELEHVAREKEAREARGEVIKRQDLRGTGSLEQQVFKDFAKFLGGKDAEIRYEGNKLEIRMTSDGKYIITVPEASFENMIQVAQTISKDAFADKVGVEALPEKLMDAALILERQAIFSTSAIEGLYNAGYQLKRALDKSISNEYFSFAEIQGAAKKLFAVMNPEQRAALQKRVDDIYLGVFLGKHDVKGFVKDEKGKVHIQKEGRGKIYDALFDRWQKSEEGKAWLDANGYASAERLLGAKDKEKEKIIAAYDAWLVDPARQYDLLHRIKPFIEENAVAGGRFERRYGVLLNQWRRLLLNSEGIKSIKAQIDKEIGNGQISDKRKLEIVAEMFQPNGQIAPDALKYVPAEVLKIFQNPGSTPDQRNEAACIIADSYVKTLLQDRGFGVFTQLVTTDTGGHTRLIAVSKKDGKAYFVDPNAPKGEKAVEEIRDPKILGQLREEIPASERKTNGDAWQMKHNINFKVAGGAVIADGNALLTSGFLTNMIDTVNLPEEARFAAAQRAASLFPENPAAWIQMAKYSEGKKREEYLKQAVSLGFDKNKAENFLSKKDKKLRIGLWNPIAPGTYPPLDAIVAQANTWITDYANAQVPPLNPATLSLEVLTEDQLRVIEINLETALRNAGLPPNGQLETYKMIGQINARLRETQPPQLFTALTPEQIDILWNKDATAIRELTEKQIKDVSREIQAGAYLNQNAQQSIQDKLNPLRQYLDARISRDPHNQAVRDAREYVVNVIQLYSGLTNVVGLIESGDPKQIEQAMGLANQMDTEGGLIVLHTVSTMHEGRPQGLVSDFRREMKQAMQRNFEAQIAEGKPGRYYLTHEDYLKLPDRIIDQQRAMAAQGVGPYAARFRDAAGNPDMAKIEEQLAIDIKLAQMMFVTTGEASSIYIQGRFPDKQLFDPGAMQFLNAQWQNLGRYFEITDTNMQVAQQQFEHACRDHLEEIRDERTRHHVHEILKDKELFQRYSEAHALNIVAPQVNFWWENRFLRTLPMIQSLIQYEEAIGAAPAAGYELRRVRDKDKGLDIGAPVGGNPEFGILLRAFFYMGEGFYGNRGDALRLFQGKGADYFPDVLIEPFAHQSGTEHTDKSYPGPADTRFVALFSGNVANFLGARVGDESDYALAMRRFNEFQNSYRPKMDAIRNKRINNPMANPVQTNFALSNADPQSAWVDVQAAFGGAANDFRLFMAEMQNLVRGTNHDGENGFAYTLTYDPLFENQHYSPLSVTDVPMWMLDGDDLMASNRATNGDLPGVVTTTNRKQPLRVELGGRNRVGRQFGDVLELGEKTRAGFIEFIKANPNSTAGILKIVEKMAEGVNNTRGSATAHELEISIMGKYLLMMHPEVADWFGFKDGIAGIRGANTQYREIFGKEIGSLSREEILAIAQEHFLSKWPKDAQRKFRRILRIRDRDRNARLVSQSLFIFLLSTIFATGEAIFGAVNPGEQAA